MEVIYSSDTLVAGVDTIAGRMQLHAGVRMINEIANEIELISLTVSEQRPKNRPKA